MEFVERTSAGESLRLALRHSGDRDQTPVLLVHGMGSDHQTWRRLAARLRRTGRAVVSVDLRGHGRSSRSGRYLLDDFRDDLRSVLDRLRLDEVDLVAHSLGAQVGMRLAIAEPERVRSLVLEEIPPMPRDQADLDENIAPKNSPMDWIRGIWSLATDPLPVLRFDGAVNEQVTRQFRSAEPGWWEGLSRVTAPTLVISGGPASFLPPHHLRTFSESLNRGSFVEIAAGHSVHRDRADEFNTAATEFLRQFG